MVQEPAFRALVNKMVRKKAGRKGREMGRLPSAASHPRVGLTSLEVLKNLHWYER